MTAVLLVPAGLVLVGLAGSKLFRTLVRLEAAGRSHVTVAVVLGLVILEALLYPNQGTVPAGLFYPTLAGQAFRIPQLLIPLALLARVAARGRMKTLSTTGLAWTIFFVWYLAGFVLGYFYGNPLVDMLFVAKAVVYIGGGYALAAGARPAAFVARGATGRWALVLGVLVAFSGSMKLAGASLAFDLPMLSVSDGGTYAADASTTISLVALVLLLVEACRRRPRGLVAGLLALLVLSPLLGSQRAALISAASAVSVAALALVGRTWRRRATVTAVQAWTVLLGLIAIGLAVFVFSVGGGGEPPPVAQQLGATLQGEAKQASAVARERLWNDTTRMISERPLMGWGLGRRTLLRQVGTPPIETAAHNLVLELLVQLGVVGLLLFSSALAMSLRGMLRAWRRHPDPEVAALALGCAAATVGLVAGAMVQPLFELFRLATVFGLVLGVGAAAATSFGSFDHLPGLRRQPRALPAA